MDPFILKTLVLSAWKISQFSMFSFWIFYLAFLWTILLFLSFLFYFLPFLPFGSIFWMIFSTLFFSLSPEFKISSLYFYFPQTFKFLNVTVLYDIVCCLCFIVALFFLPLVLTVCNFKFSSPYFVSSELLFPSILFLAFMLDVS